MTGARRRSLGLAALAAIASAVIAMPSMTLAAPPDQAAPPDFAAPWACGESWYGSSYPDHGNGDRALDFNEADDAEAGMAALAAAPGIVHFSDTERFEPSDQRVSRGQLRMADETELRVGKGADVSLWRFNGQLYIDHGNGWYSFYAHLDPSRPSVEEGAQVETGDVLGFVDDSPNPLMATGVHLHYEQKLDAQEPYSVYEAKTQRMQFGGVVVPDPGARGAVQVVSLNCDGDPAALGLALQATAFADDLLMATAAGRDQMRFRRYLIDDEQVMRSRDVMNLRADRAADRFLVGDFTNDGLDDLAVVVQERDGSFRLRVWSEGRDRVTAFYDPGNRYALGVNQGRIAAGDFDGDGFTDDIVMARYIGADRMRLVRYLFDGAGSVTIKRHVVGLQAARVGDRMVVGDFTNDGTDDVAFVVQQRDGSFRVRVWDAARAHAGVFFDARHPYSLAATQGRLISGDFDGDGFTDDLAMAGRVGPNQLDLRRFLLDGANEVTISRETIRVQRSRSGDQLLRGDFDNDGTDDAGLVVWRSDGTIRVRAFSAAAGDGYHLVSPFGRSGAVLVSGNFDRN